MSGVCPAPNVDAGVVKSVLSAVDCNVRYYSQAGYFALTGPDSVFPTALTLLLTLYVAIVGYRLLLGLGGARLADAPMMAVKIGFILALTLNWTAFQTLVFDVAIKAPVELARIVARPAAASAHYRAIPSRVCSLPMIRSCSTRQRSEKPRAPTLRS